MASEKDPSIYYDRGTIGSSDELDEYGVWVKSEPQDLSSVNPDNQDTEFSIPDMEDLPDFDIEPAETEDYSFSFDDTDTGLPAEADDFSIPEADVSEEFGSSFDGPRNDGPEEAEASDPDIADEAGFTEVSMEDFLGEPDGLGEPAFAEEEPEDNMELEAVDSGMEITEDPLPDFDDVAAVSRDLREPEPPRAQAGGVDLSTQLLMKIADELSSIRTELSSLKNELAVIRSEAPAAESGEEQGGGGFFDEEDDEKIALTGDELDNILNTADFTEEAGSDATEEFPDDFSSLEASEPETGETLLSDLPDIISGEPGLDLDEPDLDEIPGELDFMQSGPGLPLQDDDSPESAGESSLGFDDGLSGEGPEEISIDIGVNDFPASADEESLAEKDSEELQKLREQGAEPMTPPPEDTSYLDEDPLAAEQPDLSGAVIDEPDLSAGLEENPIEEPSLDNIGLDLDLDESLVISPGAAEADPGELDFEEEPGFPVSEGAEDIDLNLSEDINLNEAPEDVNLDMPEDINLDEAPEDVNLDMPEDITLDEVPEDINLDMSEDISLDEPPEDINLDMSEDISLDEAPEDISLDEAPEDINLDMSEDISLDEAPEDISLDMPGDISLDETPEDINLDMPGDISLDEAPEDISLDMPGGLDEAPEDTSLDMPGGLDEAPEDSGFDMISLDESPGEESFAQVMPEGFAVEADDARGGDEPVSGDFEAFEEAPEAKPAGEPSAIPVNLKQELKTVLSYMDQLLESLPEEKIEEFAKSEYFDTYKKLFEELGLV
jgi:hypothetical protein